MVLDCNETILFGVYLVQSCCLTCFVIYECVYVWVCVCVSFVMCECVYVWVLCGCFDKCVGVLVICVLVFTVFLYCFVYVYLFLFVTSVRTTATE
jgi:hypothetical protein